MRIPATLLLCAFAAAAAPAFAQSYTFTFFAGMPPPTGSRDGVGSEARFNEPLGLVVDGAGNIFVADRNNAVIRKISPAGVVTTFAGLAGSTGSSDGTGASARFNQPTGIAIDGAGNLFVTDRADHTVRKITPAGVVTTFAGLAGSVGAIDATGSAARFRIPYGIAVDGEGSVYVSDSGNRTVRKISSAGTVSTLAGVSGVSGNTDGAGSNARFTAPAGLAIDGSGNLYVSDSVSHLIRKITSAGVVTTVAGGAGVSGNTNGVGTAARFSTPLAVVADSGGTVYVADTVNETIRRVTPDGTVSVFAGSAIGGNLNGTGASARFFRPQGIALDRDGNVYVSDTFNHTIRKLTTAAVSSTLAGPGGNFGSADGTGQNALFNRPRGIGVDSQGNLFVAESFNATIRKITPTGDVSTFAGVAGAVAYTDGTGTGARFGYPFGVAVDSSDNIFVTDAIYNALRRITPAGVVRTWAGTPNLTGGSTEGPINTGRMNFPQGTAIDRDGNAYIADAGNHTIRKVLPSSEITTFAGLAGSRGSADGAAAVARFSSPSAVALDGAGNVYVADYDNSTIRKITPGGVVSTFAGLAGSIGSADGNGSAARFQNPDSLAIDAAGNVFVSDSNNQTVRRITPDGTVTTIGGLVGSSGVVAEGSGASARFFIPSGIAVTPSGVLYVVSAFANVIMKGVLDVRPTIEAHPRSQQVLAGASVTLSVTATGGGLSYQWKFNGTAIPGANSPTLTVPNIGPGAAGAYTVDITNTAGTVTSNAAAIAVVAPTTDVGRITNLAIRSQAGTGGQTLIVGVNVGGAGTTGTKPVLLRGVGPTLGLFNVPGVLTDPKLELFSGAGVKINENDDWAGNTQVSTIAGQVGAFAFNSITSKDAALYNSTFAPGSYSVWITGNGGATGVALAEIYDATPASAYTATTPRLTNVSARTQVGTGGDILIAGFAISGQTSKTVLIRAIGPTLGTFGVPGTLANPKLELFTGTTKIDENDNWGGAAALSNAFLSVAAFPLPAASLDAVLLVTLAPGSYTAQVSGVGGGTGVALVEVYEIP